MPLSDFQRTKLARLFDVYDLNGDGLLEESDFTRRAHQFARERGWTEESSDFRELLDYTREDWVNLQLNTDADGDGAVTRDEFIGFADRRLTGEDAVDDYAYADAYLIFRAMDADHDGKITADEWKMFLRAHHIGCDSAHYFFQKIDNDEDGFVTRDEISRALKEFFFSNDIDAPGNCFYGRLDERLERSV